MDVINEKGELYSTSYTKSTEVETEGLWLPVGVRKFCYSKVVWIDSLKFAFGRWDAPGKITDMVEVSTGAIAVNAEEAGSNEVSEMLKKYQQKLSACSIASGEELVKIFNSKFIQAWQINLWIC